MGLPKFKTCPTCEKEFSTRISAQVYCDACRKAKYKKPELGNKGQARKKTGQADLWLVPRRRPRSTAERFLDPIMKVDIQTGQVYINRMPEHWTGKEYN